MASLVEENEPLVQYVARELQGVLPGHVGLAVLERAGREGLARAAGAYDRSAGLTFARWAKPRIRAAMLNAVSDLDWSETPVLQGTTPSTSHPSAGQHDVTVNGRWAQIDAVLADVPEPGRSVVRALYSEQRSVDDVAVSMHMEVAEVVAARDAAIAAVRQRLVASQSPSVSVASAKDRRQRGLFITER